MLLLVVSDSHSYISNLETALIGEKYDTVVHLGDFAEDMRIAESLTKGRGVLVCRGNCDRNDTDYETEHIFTVNGVKIFCSHGHRFNVKYGLDSLYFNAMKAGADICLFGHTHEKFCEEYNGILMLNPGAICNGEYALIDIKNKNSITVYNIKTEGNANAQKEIMYRSESEL